MVIRKLLAAAGVAATVATAGLATASDASAINYDCSGSHSVCLYYNSSAYGYGAYYAQGSDISDYAGHYFSAGNNGSAGAGVEVKNNAAAVDSWYGANFVVYYNSGYNCSYACQTIPAWQTVDLNSTMKNNNASGQFH